MVTLLDEIFYAFGKKDRKEICSYETEAIKKYKGELDGTLDEKQQLYLLRMIDEYDTMVSEMSIENFKCGMLFGARVMRELFDEFFEEYDCTVE